MKAYNLTVDESLILSHDLTQESAVASARHLFSLPNRPDGIFCINDPTAIAGMLVAKEMKIRITHDIAFVGFSDEPSAALIEPGLTTPAQPKTKSEKLLLSYYSTRSTRAIAS